MGAVPDGDVRHTHPQRWIGVGGAFTLVQSGLMLGGAAVGLSLWTCTLQTKADVAWQMVRLYYFANIDCSKTYVVNGSNYELDDYNRASLRTVIIFSLYTALSSIWFIGSIILIVSAIKGKHLRPVLGKYLHYPWIISMVLILILDIIASILYCVDLLFTTDFSTVMGLLSIKSSGDLHELNEDYLSVPPMIMALLTSKGVLFWIIDIIVFVCLIPQFRKLFSQRQQAEFVRAQLATMPAYLWPPQLVQKNLTSTKNDPNPPIIPTATLPRLVHQDGILVGQTSSATVTRPSALQRAAREGFSYERPPSQAWNVANPDNSTYRAPKMTTPQKYGYDAYPQDSTDNWYRRRESAAPRDADRSSNILQRDNDVFY